jgi:hypothetical protein
LHHHEAGSHRRHLLEQPDDNRRRHVVREVRDAAPRPGAQQVAEVDGERVAGDDAHVRVVRDLALQNSNQLLIDLEREHRAPALPQGEREGPQPGSDLHHPVAGVDPGEAHDAASRVGIGDEVLPAPREGRSPCSASNARTLAGVRRAIA